MGAPAQGMVGFILVVIIYTRQLCVGMWGGCSQAVGFQISKYTLKGLSPYNDGWLEMDPNGTKTSQQKWKSSKGMLETWVTSWDNRWKKWEIWIHQQVNCDVWSCIHQRDTSTKLDLFVVFFSRLGPGLWFPTDVPRAKTLEPPVNSIALGSKKTISFESTMLLRSRQLPGYNMIHSKYT